MGNGNRKVVAFENAKQEEGKIGERSFKVSLFSRLHGKM